MKTGTAPSPCPGWTDKGMGGPGTFRGPPPHAGDNSTIQSNTSLSPHPRAHPAEACERARPTSSLADPLPRRARLVVRGGMWQTLTDPLARQGEALAERPETSLPSPPSRPGGGCGHLGLRLPHTPHRAPRRDFSGKSSLFPTRSPPHCAQGQGSGFSCTSRILNTSPLPYRVRGPYPASRSPRPSSPFAHRTRKHSHLARRDDKATSPVARRTRPRQRTGLHHQLDSPVARRTKPAWRQGPHLASGLRRRGLPRFSSVPKRTKSTHFQPTL